MPSENPASTYPKRTWVVQTGNFLYSHLALLERDFSNLDYLYEHLPARYRREDRTELLKRFLTFVGETLDGWDDIFDGFYQFLNPDTAPEEFLTWWLWALFGWGWYPEGFTLAQKRELFRKMAVLYARRGTKRGIEEFMAVFGVNVEVFNRPAVWGETVWGEDAWAIVGPLGIVVRVYPRALAIDDTFWGEAIWGESPMMGINGGLSRADIEALLRFVTPNAQVVMIEDRLA